MSVAVDTGLLEHTGTRCRNFSSPVVCIDTKMVASAESFSGHMSGGVSEAA